MKKDINKEFAVTIEEFDNLVNTIKSQFSDLLYWDTCDNGKCKYYLLDNNYRLYCVYCTDDETDYFSINLEYLGPDFINIIGVYESEQATLSQLENCISEALITYYNILEQKHSAKLKENKKEIETMENKITIKLNNGKEIVAELCNYDGNHPEIIVCVHENGIAVQDLCIIRPHEDEQCNHVGDDIDCLVWADETYEDYTHKFVISHYEEEDC